MRMVLLEGRLVSGHPMEEHPVLDDATKQPKLNAAGKPRKVVNIGIAIPKTPGVADWKNEPWGREFVAEAMESWPNGEHESPLFSWKVTDGDSTTPNRKGNRPCDKDGYPGHWVVFASGELGPIRCFHNGKFQPHECIQDPREIKRGDYGRLNVMVKGNAPSQTPGIYVNPDMFALDRPGEPILGGETNAADVFGGGGSTPAPAAAPAPAAPAAATPAPAPAAAPAPTPAPAPAPAAAPAHVMTEKAAGASYEQFIAQGWTDEQLIAQGYMQAPGGVTPAPAFLNPPAA